MGNKTKEELLKDLDLWEFRYSALEHWLALIIMNKQKVTMEQAVTEIRRRCEDALYCKQQQWSERA